jgi:hypothetical protein
MVLSSKRSAAGAAAGIPQLSGNSPPETTRLFRALPWSRELTQVKAGLAAAI